MSADYDVIVIGAGNAGLTVAATLARGGARTLLLERHNIPGGCATTFVRGRFEFEVSLHQLSGVGTEDQPGPLRHIFGALGVLDKIKLHSEDSIYRAVVGDDLDIVVPADWAEAQRVLTYSFPDEADGIRNYFALVDRISRDLFGVARYLHDAEGLKIAREKFPTFMEYGLIDAKTVLDRHIRSPELKSALTMYWGYLGLPLHEVSFQDLAVTFWAYVCNKPWYVEGGSQALSNAICAAFVESGGHTRFNCKANRIIVSEGKVRGVVTEHGDEISARAVICNASPILTYSDLIDDEHVPEEALRDLTSRSTGISATTLYMGLDCAPEEIGIFEPTSMIGDSHDIEEQFRKTRTLEAPGFLGFTCYNHADPTAAPEGAANCSLIALQYADPWVDLAPEEYAATKYRYADAMLARAERVYPGIRGHIEEAEVATPLTSMRYLNTPGGSIYGFDLKLTEHRLVRQNRSFIDGLYHTGTWVTTQGFQPTLMGGTTTARRAMRALN